VGSTIVANLAAIFSLYKGGKKYRRFKMQKIWLALVGVVLLVGVLVLAGCSAEGTSLTGGNLKVDMNSQQNGIWVSGEGKVYATPDIALITLGIESKETSVAEAQTKAADAMDRVVAALKDSGIAEEDIQTQYFSIQEVTKWEDKTQENTVIGYQVTNTVTAKVRKVAQAGTIIDAVVAAGGDLTRINNISFTVDDPTPYYNQAREKAATYAKAKANQLAELAGVKLGKVTYVSESTYMPYSSNVYYNRSDVAVPAPAIINTETSISPGQLEITANVQLTYAIAD
jgi:uncharacterized protein YggE